MAKDKKKKDKKKNKVKSKEAKLDFLRELNLADSSASIGDAPSAAVQDVDEEPSNSEFVDAFISELLGSEPLTREEVEEAIVDDEPEDDQEPSITYIRESANLSEREEEEDEAPSPVVVAEVESVLETVDDKEDEDDEDDALEIEDVSVEVDVEGDDRSEAGEEQDSQASTSAVQDDVEDDVPLQRHSERDERSEADEPGDEEERESDDGEDDDADEPDVPVLAIDIEDVPFELPDEDMLFELADLFKIFADPTRLRILYCLAEGPKCVADISKAAGVTQGATSHQLRSMKQARIVDFVRDGKQVIYSLADSRVKTVLALGYSYIND